MSLIFDLETDGLLPEVTVIHTLTIYDTATGKYVRYDKEDVPKGIARLEAAETIIGHNIIGYDVPVIEKLLGIRMTCRILDTMVWARLIYADIKGSDFKRGQQGTLPTKLIGSFALEAFGYRLGILKGEFGKTADWSKWTQEMSDYCEQDVRVTAALYQALLKNFNNDECSREAIDLEHAVATIVTRQERHGVLFKQKEAETLYSTLVQRRDSILPELQEMFPAWYRRKGKEFVPKADNKRYGYVKDCPVTKIELKAFNPSSDLDIIHVLRTRYGWKPEVFTIKGQAKVSDDIIKTLDYPCIPLLREYLLVDKRLSQVGDGKQAWLRNIDPDGRIRGRVLTNGAVTGRMIHTSPNLAQVPAVGKPYGAECRGLFAVREGYVMVGCDAAGLELRDLGHFMAKYDGGAYVRIILDGDIHTQNQEAAGLDTRDKAKRFIYAYLYGAGDELIGALLLPKGSTRQKKAKGKAIKAAFLAKTPALKQLKEALEATVGRGYILGLDGRRVKVRHAHAVLNTLLQSAGALVMKKALVILDAKLQEAGLTPFGRGGTDYEFVLNIHDEWQLEVLKKHGDLVGKLAVDAINEAGEYFNFRCPLDGEYKIGESWADTH